MSCVFWEHLFWIFNENYLTNQWEMTKYNIHTPENFAAPSAPFILIMQPDCDPPLSDCDPPTTNSSGMTCLAINGVLGIPDELLRVLLALCNPFLIILGFRVLTEIN